jgi:hypothetical protein
MGYARQGAGQLWTPEQARELGYVLLRILRGTAIPIFDETDQAGPALKVDVRPTVLEDDKVLGALPVSFEASQWQRCVLPELENPMWNPNLPVNQAMMRTTAGAMSLSRQIGIHLGARFVAEGYGPAPG